MADVAQTMRPVAALDDLTPGRSHVFEIGSAKVLLIRLGDEVRATSAWCTHARTVLGPFPVDDDGLIECPMHGAVFSSEDGSLLGGPTCDPLPVYAVEIREDGMVHVAVPDDAGEPPAGPRPSGLAAWSVGAGSRFGPPSEGN